MTPSIFEHLPGCTPLSPCKSCQTVSFLKAHLKEEHFKTLINMISGEKVVHIEPIPLDTPLSELGLFSKRIRFRLEDAGCVTIGDIVKKTSLDFLSVRNFGRLSLLELRSALGNVGHKLSDDK